MTRWIVAKTMRLAVAVVVAAAALVFVAVAALRHASVDTLPEFLPPQVQVQTEALGLSAAEVEQLITVPLEDEFNGIAFLDRITSQSVPSLSSITLTFHPGTNIYTARQLVSERVAQGPALVNIGTPPVMVQPLSSESRVMMIGLSSKAMSLTDLSTLARWRIRPRLLAVPGVANVVIWGQRDRQLQVLADPARMTKAGVTVDQVVSTTGDAMWTSPLSFVEASSPGADGFIDTPNQRLSVQHILPIKNPADLAQVPVEDAKPNVNLGDVATVVDGYPALRGDAVLQSGTGFILVIQKSPGANTLGVTRGIDAAMSELAPGLHGVTVDTTIFRPASFVQSALDNVGLAAVVGLTLVVAGLGLLAWSWRAALVALVAVSVSLLAAAYILYLEGATFTMVTLAGFLVAVGVIIDDAILGVSALGASARQPTVEPDGPPDEAGRGEAIAEAVTEATTVGRRPLGVVLAILVVAVLPIYALRGVGGHLAKPLIVAYLLALVTSTVVALTVTPAMSYLLRLRGRPPEGRADPAARWAERVVVRVLPAVSRRPLAAYGSAALLAVVAVAVVPQIGGGSLVPALQDRDLVVQWQALPGTSLTEMDRITQDAGNALRAVPGVGDVASHAGQALLGDQIVDVDSGETWISIRSGADYGATVAAIGRVLHNYPGLVHTVSTYPRLTLDAANTTNGKAVTVRLYGSDLQVLQDQAGVIRRSLSGVSGVVDAQVQSPAQQPTIQIAADVGAAARYGLSPGAIRRDTAVLVGGIPVGSYYQENEIFDVTVWSEPTVRQNLTAIQHLLLDTPSGGQVPLSKVATVSIAPAPTEIDHDQVSRYIDITADVRGAGVGSVLAAVRAHVLPRSLPLGYHADVFSDTQRQQQADTRTLLYALLALGAVFLLLQAVVASWRRAALILVGLPLALSGGALTARIAGAHLTIGSLIGFIALFALAVRNAVQLMDRIDAVERDQPAAEPGDLALGAARQMAGPVVTTAAVTALALLPFLVRATVAGVEIARPLALVVWGGLVTTTLVTLVVLPALYPRVVRRPKPAVTPSPATPPPVAPLETP